MTSLEIFNRLFTDYPALNECKESVMTAFTLAGCGSGSTDTAAPDPGIEDGTYVESCF